MTCLIEELDAEAVDQESQAYPFGGAGAPADNYFSRLGPKEAERVVALGFVALSTRGRSTTLKARPRLESSFQPPLELLAPFGT